MAARFASAVFVSVESDQSLKARLRVPAWQIELIVKQFGVHVARNDIRPRPEPLDEYILSEVQ